MVAYRCRTDFSWIVVFIAAGADAIFSGHRDSVFSRPFCGPLGGEGLAKKHGNAHGIFGINLAANRFVFRYLSFAHKTNSDLSANAT